MIYFMPDRIIYFIDLPCLMSRIPRIIKDLFINGKFTKAVKGQTFDVINPATEEILATIQRGTN